MATHELKTHPGPFLQVWDGMKPFEWRKDDREPKFAPGDLIKLIEWDPEAAAFTGRKIFVPGLYVARGIFGIPEGFCVFGLEMASGLRIDRDGSTSDLPYVPNDGRGVDPTGSRASVTISEEIRSAHGPDSPTLR